MSTPVHRASHEYTEGWCEGGEIGHVALSGGAPCATCASAAARPWS
jgi:hypothetical protein